jgi:hypothetical protein
MQTQGNGNAIDGQRQGLDAFQDLLELAPVEARPALAAVEAEACAWAMRQPRAVRDQVCDVLADWVRDPRLRTHFAVAAGLGIARGLDEASDESWAKFRAGQTPEE